MKRKYLLLAIGGVNPLDSNIFVFNMDKNTPHLAHQLAFQVYVQVKGKGIHHTIIDEGEPTYVMATTCWLSMGSPKLAVPSNSLKYFDGHTFIPKGYLATFPITLEGKNVMVNIEVFDHPLNYNLLLGCTWTYSMKSIVFLVFDSSIFLTKEKL